MESELHRPSDHAGLNPGEHGEEHHQHKSVLKKVKDKAKKIKDKITHGHSHEHDEGDDDDVEETVNVPHIHGAPMHDSPLNKSPNLPRDTNINAGKPREQDLMHEGIARPTGPITHEGIPKPVTPGMITHEGLPKPVTPGMITHGETPKPATPGPVMHGGTPRPVTTGPITHEGMPKPAPPGPIMHGGTHRPVSPGPIMHEGMDKPISPVPLAEAFGKRNSPKPKKKVGLEQDPHSPAVISKSNDQSKVVDPTGVGGKEANVAPLVGQFGNLNVIDEKPESKQSPYHTGTHDDQFSPHKTPTRNLSNPDPNPDYTPGTENPDPSPMIQDNSTTITGKLSAAATAAADTAISAKNVVASKLGYGGGAPQADQGYETGLRPGNENPDPNPSPKTQDSTNQNTITEKMSSAAISAKNTVASKLGYVGGPQSGQGYETGSRPGNENPDPSPKIQDPTNQNTITDKMSSAAISAKNTVASKLGYGGGGAQADQGYETGSRLGDENPHPSPKIQDSRNQNTISDKISTAATAATGTAISAKNVVASKLGYGGGGARADEGGEKTGTVKDYLGEKLRPGEEDRALSEVITGALSRKEEKGSVVEQPGSRVKVSKEVEARLGPATETKREGEDALAAGAESSGPGVVGRLKDAVGSWLGKSDGVQTAQDSIEGSYVGDGTSGGGAKRES